MAFEPITTQEDFDKAIAERINRAKDQTRKEFDGWLSPDDVKAQTEKLTSENATMAATIQTQIADIETLKGEAEKTKQQIAKYETDSVKTRVANELGLSIESLEFIGGGTEDEIRASAQALKKLVGTQAPPRFNPDKGTDNPFKQMLTGLND